MSVQLRLHVGARPTVEVTLGRYRLNVSAGSDYEGGRVANMMVDKRVGSPYGGKEWSHWRGLHAANGTHSGWLWFGVRRDWKLGSWRVALWWPIPTRKLLRIEP